MAFLVLIVIRILYGWNTGRGLCEGEQVGAMSVWKDLASVGDAAGGIGDRRR